MRETPRVPGAEEKWDLFWDQGWSEGLADGTTGAQEEPGAVRTAPAPGGRARAAPGARPAAHDAGGFPSQGPRREAVEALVGERFGGQASPAGKVRLVLLNGNGIPGIGAEVARILVPEGFRVVESGNAKSFDMPQTLIVASSEGSSHRPARLGSCWAWASCSWGSIRPGSGTSRS